MSAMTKILVSSTFVFIASLTMISRSIIVSCQSIPVTPGGHQPQPTHTHCWSSSADTSRDSHSFRCVGEGVSSVPQDLPVNTTKLQISDSLMSVLPSKSFVRYAALRDIHIRNFTRLVSIEPGVFDGLPDLQILIITECLSLHTIGPGVFGTFMNLDFLRINKCGLTSIPDFSKFETKSEAQNSSMYEIDLSSNKIEVIKAGDFGHVKTYILGLENNMIRRIEDKAFAGGTIKQFKCLLTLLCHKPVDDIIISYMKTNGEIKTTDTIHRMKIVRCKNNAYLYELGQHAFSGIQELDFLDLTRSQINNLPTEGLIDIEELVLEDTPSLKEFPSVFKFSRIHTAKLTYPHHCCAFSHANQQRPPDPTSFESVQDDGACATHVTSPAFVDSSDYITATSSSMAPPIKFRIKRDESRFQFFSSERRTYSQSEEDDGDNGQFLSGHRDHTNGVGKSEDNLGFSNFNNMNPTPGSIGAYDSPKFGPIPPRNKNRPSTSDDKHLSKSGAKWHLEPLAENETKFVTCGNFSPKDYSRVQCTPRPNAFNPCEDVMGYGWLRVLVWFVLLAALCGNLVVMLVLSTARSKLTVPKFLMCNLSFADFLMGFYLLLIASVDVHSLGEYFTHAVTWQNDGGCQVAGFLTVFSSELSVFVLTVITLERWYAISQAIHVNRRLRMRQAAVLMFIGWIYASSMAILPLTGISGYGAVSMCLPMEAKDIVDILYIIALLVFNGIAFVAICGCYISMYLQVMASENMARSNDATIAKRMAILVLTNFICWAPIAFFGLTASFGFPLIDVTNSKILLVFFYPFNSCANPFLYAILTKQFRRDFFILLGRHGICTARANRYKGTTMTRSYSNSRNNGLLLNTVNNATDISILSQYRNSKSSISLTSAHSINYSGAQTPKIMPICASIDTTSSSPSPKKVHDSNSKPTLFSALNSVVDSRSSSSTKLERKLSTVIETSHASDDSGNIVVTGKIHNMNDDNRVLEGRDSLRDLFDGKPHGRVRSASEYVVIFRNDNCCQIQEPNRNNPVQQQDQQSLTQKQRKTSVQEGSFQRQASRDTSLSSNTLNSFLSDSGSSRIDSDSEIRIPDRRLSSGVNPNDLRRSSGSYFNGKRDYSAINDGESIYESESLLDSTPSSNHVHDSSSDIDANSSSKYDATKTTNSGSVGDPIMENFHEEDEEVELNREEFSPETSDTERIENPTDSATQKLTNSKTVKPIWFTSKNGSGQTRRVSFCDDRTNGSAADNKKESKLKYSFLRRK